MTSFLSGIGSILVVSALVVGCDGGDEKVTRGAGCAGAKCDDGAIEALAAPTWAACWVEPGASDAALMCRQPADAVWSATAVYAQRVGVAGQIALGEGAVEIARVPNDSGPIDVRVWANPNMGALGTSGLQTTAVEAVLHIASAAAATPSQPATLAAPFALWPIDLATPDGIATIDSEAQVVALTPWSSAGRSELDIVWGAYARAGSVSRFYVAVPPSGAWHCGLEHLTDEGMTTRRIDVTLNGPGRWVANASGLRPATPGDASLFAGAPVTVDPGTPGTTDPGTPGTAEPGTPGTPGTTEPAPAACDDAGYLAWLAGFSATFADAGDTLSEGERQTLSAEIAALACTPDSDAAYVAWLALWKDRFDRALPSDTSIVDADERAALELVLAARPDADGDAAFEAWFAQYTARLTAYLPNDTSIIDDTERANLTLLSAARPDSASELAYVAWLSTWRGYFESALPTETSIIDADERAKLAVIAEVRPHAAGDQAWSAWLDVFTYRLGMAGETVNDDERAALELLATIKPCGGSASAAQLAALSGDAAMIALADPSRCE